MSVEGKIKVLNIIVSKQVDIGLFEYILKLPQPKMAKLVTYNKSTKVRKLEVAEYEALYEYFGERNGTGLLCV